MLVRMCLFDANVSSISKHGDKNTNDVSDNSTVESLSRLFSDSLATLTLTIPQLIDTMSHMS